MALCFENLKMLVLTELFHLELDRAEKKQQNQKRKLTLFTLYTLYSLIILKSHYVSWIKDCNIYHQTQFSLSNR